MNIKVKLINTREIMVQLSVIRVTKTFKNQKKNKIFRVFSFAHLLYSISLHR